MVAWYEQVLGMKSGKRPNFPFPGAWMYVGDQAAVHLIGVDGDPGVGSEGLLKLEHFAFQATGFTDMIARLEAAAQRYQVNAVPGRTDRANQYLGSGRQPHSRRFPVPQKFRPSTSRRGDARVWLVCLAG